jgi:hypothetical protein
MIAGYLAIYRELSDTSSDQLCVLRTEVENEDGLAANVLLLGNDRFACGTDTLSQGKRIFNGIAEALS